MSYSGLSETGYTNDFNFNDPYPTAQEQRNGNDEDVTSTLKRTACVLCRKRKLRCDTARPKCGTCDRLGHACEYNEVRKKSGPKRGYVKALEARLSEVETRLKSGSDSNAGAGQRPTTGTSAFPTSFPSRNLSDSPHNVAGSFSNGATDMGDPEISIPSMEPSLDMVSLGLEEPLPTPEVQRELFEIYFRKIHPTAPMIHKARFYTALNYAPHMRPPVALRYAMWTLASSASDAYHDMQQHFYRRARKYMELDEMRAYGEAILSLYSCQTSVLCSIYEFKNMHFPRAWLSTGRAVRLSQMLGLQRLDGAGLEVKTCCAPPVDWTEKEERKRTFWMVFWEDRCASIGTGWPMSIDEQDIMTNLPASEEAFQNSNPELTPSLDGALKGDIQNVSAFASAIMLTALFGRNLLHLHRPGPDEREHDLNGGYWKRHRSIDSTLLNISLNLPDHLRIPRGLPDPNVMFMNMCIHTSVICLHQAAIFKIDRLRLPANLGQESKVRCVTAAAEIANIMRSISHCDLGTLNPFSAFCLYVAARVHVQYLKSRRGDSQIVGSLHFLLSAMHALKRKTPLAESFLAQLDVDLMGAGIPMDYESSLESLKSKGFPDLHKKQAQGGASRPLAGGISRDVSMDMGASPENELRTSGNRFSPFANQNGAKPWKTVSKPDEQPAMIGDYGWREQYTDASASRQPSIDGSISTIGMQSAQSGSSGSGQPAFSPSESSGDDNTGPAIDYNAFTSNQGAPSGYDDNQPAGFINFKDYPPAMNQMPGTGQNFALTGQSPMTQQQFDDLTRQFMPLTPGGGLEGWSSGISSGLTPQAGSEDWTSLLNNIENWEPADGMQNEGWSTTQFTNIQ